MSVIGENGFYLPNSDFVEIPRREDLRSGSIQTALTGHLATRQESFKLLCGCSDSTNRRELIPFHEPSGLVGLRRERIEDGHPVTCFANRELENRDQLTGDDFSHVGRTSANRALSVTRFGWVALQNAANAYSALWSGTFAAVESGHVRPGRFLAEFSDLMAKTLLPGRVALVDFLGAAHLKLITGVVKALPLEREEPAVRQLLPAVVWLGTGLHPLPLAVESWLIECLRRSISIYGKVIPGPYLFAAILKDGLVINMWLKPIYLGGENMGIVDSGCEGRFARHLDACGQVWLKPPTRNTLFGIPEDRQFWDFNECRHRFDFAVYTALKNVIVVETTTFDLLKHPLYKEVSERRVAHFRALAPQNGFAVRVVTRCAHDLPLAASGTKVLQFPQGEPDLEILGESMLALLRS